jgi:hypothetical protein
MRVRLRAIREEVRSEGAKCELAQLKQQLRPQALSEPEPASAEDSAGAEERVVPVAAG